MKIKETLVLFLILYVLFELVPVGNGSTTTDFTSVWYYGCRWLGGSSIGLVCNCTEQAEEIYIQQQTITSTDIERIEFNNCPKIRFGSNSIKLLRNLRTLTLHNSNSIVLEENSLNWIGYRTINTDDNKPFDFTIPSLRITISQSRIANIGSLSFTGRLNEITIDNCRIDNIEAFAFSNLLQTEHVQVRYSSIKNVQPQAFKKFTTQFLTLYHVTAGVLPSRTFSDITVNKNILIDYCHFETLRSSAFIISNPQQLIVSNTRIGQIEGEAFWVTDCSNAMFRFNVFFDVHNEAFNAIKTDTTNTNMITFYSNTISNLNKRSLQVQPSLKLNVMDLRLNQTCDCENIVKTLRQSEFYNEIHCVSEGGEFVTVRDFKNSSCSVLTGYHTTIIVVCVVILVIALVIIVFYLYYRLVYKSQKYGCEKGGKIPLSLIIPDGKTYKETEIHVVLERSDLLTTDL